MRGINIKSITWRDHGGTSVWCLRIIGGAIDAMAVLHWNKNWEILPRSRIMKAISRFTDFVRAFVAD